MRTVCMLQEQLDSKRAILSISRVQALLCAPPCVLQELVDSKRRLAGVDGAVQAFWRHASQC